MTNIKLNNMNDLYHQHFTNTQAQVEGSEQLWNAIQKQRKSASKKRKGGLWWLAFGVLLTIPVGLWYHFANTEYTPKNKTVPQQKIHKITPKESKNTPIAATSTPLSSPNPLVKDNRVAKTAISTSQMSKVPVQSMIIPQTNKQNKNTTTQTLSKTAMASSLVAPNIASSNTIPIAEEKLFEGTKNKTILAHFSLPTLELMQLGQSNSSSIQLDYTYLTEKFPIPTKWDKCQVKEEGTWFVKGYGQASKPLEQVEDERTTEMMTYADAWQERFSPFMSYSGGLQVGYTFPWKGYISGGLAYQHWQSKYEETNRVVEQITVYDDMAYFYIDENGETVWVGDEITETKVYNRMEVHANNYKLWHIPIQIGYITTQGSFCFGGNIEALINITQRYEGYFMEENRTILDIDSRDNEGYFQDNIGLSVSAGLHLGYMLNDHWEVYTSPRFRFNNQSVLHNDQVLSIRNNFAGLRVGVGYHF